MKKRIVSVLLALTTMLSLCACGGSKTESTQTGEATGALVGVNASRDYDEVSAELYNAALGDFYEAYQEALKEENVSKRYALEAIAEAKLMESAVMVPTQTQFGYYGISRTAPYTVDKTLWGNDNERIHQSIVATTLITAEDRAAMKTKWAELAGTGTYEAFVKSYLAEHGYEIKDELAGLYTADPVTWDVLATSLAADSEAIVQTYDGLMEYDVEGILQPALAESYEVSEDGLTYTFHLRKGVKWVDSQGREVADVKADDFVAGFQHMMDSMGGLEYLVQGVIVNANEYINSEVTDMAEVGVKAVDDYTVEYTLCQPVSYFTTMLGYGVFAPMSRSYYESQGGKFGAEFDNAAADYTYGSTADNIAYCGPFLVTSHTAGNSIVFEQNPTYWNKDKVNITKFTEFFDDSSDATRPYNDCIAGTIDSSSLIATSLELAKKDTDADGNNIYDTYGFISDTNAVTYSSFVNLNRQAFANSNDSTKAVSSETQEDVERTNAAVNNVHFRRAIAFGLDRAAYNAQQTGEDIKYNSLRNSYTPGSFVMLEEDVTVAINGKDTTFPAGTFYGEIMQAQIDADGVKIMVWDKNGNDGAGSSDGFDGWYNVENAKAEMELAIAELEEAGVEVSAENPIVLELPYPSDADVYANKANAYKQSVEASLDGLVEVRLLSCTDTTEWLYTGYYTTMGNEANFDLFDLSGWGPDYGDPQTYLDTFLPDYAGYVVKSIGLY